MQKNEIIVSSVQYGCVVRVMDLVHGPNRRFIDDVSSMMNSCDCIFLCNTEYHKVHNLLKPLIGDFTAGVTDSTWNALGYGVVGIQDVIMARKDLHMEPERIWRELRTAPLQHKYIDQSDLVWCPGLETSEHFMNNMNPDERITKISDWELEKSCE
jgi:hypothetical protein